MRKFELKNVVNISLFSNDHIYKFHAPKIQILEEKIKNLVNTRQLYPLWGAYLYEEEFENGIKSVDTCRVRVFVCVFLHTRMHVRCQHSKKLYTQSRPG